MLSMANTEKQESNPSKPSKRKSKQREKPEKETARCTVRCACGCGGDCKPGRMFLYNHHTKNWKGGKVFHESNKYIRVWCPKHPRASKNGYVYEHILIAEKALGRYIDAKHPIHHAGKDRLDNTKLVICENDDYHKLLHRRMENLIVEREYDYLDYIEEMENG